MPTKTLFHNRVRGVVGRAGAVGDGEEQKRSARDREVEQELNKPALLRDASNASVSYDSDGEACREACETDAQACAQVDEAGVEGHRGLDPARDEDRDDQPVDLLHDARVSTTGL